MTTYRDSKRENSDSLLITQDLEELASASETVSISDIGQPPSPPIVSDNPGMDDDRWEEEIEILAATQYYSDRMPLEQIRMLEDIRSDVSEEVFLMMLNQELSLDDDFISDELLSRTANLSDDESHELFELMSYLQDRRQR